MALGELSGITPYASLCFCVNSLFVFMRVHEGVFLGFELQLKRLD